MSDPTLVSPPASARDATHKAAWWALGVLTVTMLFAVLDRAVLLLQAETIRLHFGLSDFQLGFLQGTAVAIIVALVSYPLGWLADRYDRRLVLVGCVLFWSTAVVASGLSQNYMQLLIGSAMVGAGEAGLVPIANALIPQLFSQRHRQTANSVFAVSSTMVSALGMGATGLIIGAVDQLRPHLPAGLATLETWRLSFLAVAVPAPLIMALLLTIPRVAKGRAAGAGPAPVSGPSPTALAAQVVGVLPYLRSERRTFGLYYCGLAAVMLGFAGIGGWMAVIYQRVFEQTPQQLGATLGVIGVASTVTGFLGSIYALRYFAPRVGPAIGLRAMWIACITSAICFALMTLATKPWHMYALHGLFVTLITGATMVAPTVLQSMAPNAVRARVFAVTTILTSTCAAISPPIVGLISDQLTALKNGLVVAAALYAVPCLMIGTVLLRRCERPYLLTRAAVEQADAADAAAGAAAVVPGGSRPADDDLAASGQAKAT